ncbi:glycosyl transferase group 1 [Mycena latifolia]|nr:glycosyl transferase group 1 [Mycena latifolia]
MATSRTLKVAIITENFLPKVDGVTVTLMHLLEHLHARGVKAVLLGPNNGMEEYAGCRIWGAFGFPLRTYPGLKINFIPPSFIRELREFNPDVIHLVDPIWLGVQALVVIKFLFPGIPVVMSYDTNLPTYATVLGFPYFWQRMWRTLCYIHSFATFTLVPTHSTAGLLQQRGFVDLRVCDRGFDPRRFSPALRNHGVRKTWGIEQDEVAIISVGRLSLEKNLLFLLESFTLLSRDTRERAVLIFVGDGPLAPQLKMLCAEKNVRAVFLGQLTGTALGEAFSSADIMSVPSFTETFGQVTLEAMASGLPVVGLYAEGTADLVTHLRNGLLLDAHATIKSKDSWTPAQPLGAGSRVACYESCAGLLHPSSVAFKTLSMRYAALLEQLISDPTLRANMGTLALATAQKYPWDRCTDRILAAYVDASRSRASPSHITSKAGFLQFIADAMTVALAILLTGLSHILYMIPTSGDLLN